ncbi:hypothetical protein ABTH93_21010, partial [Acinetobacter baumannii]
KTLDARRDLLNLLFGVGSRITDVGLERRDRSHLDLMCVGNHAYTPMFTQKLEGMLMMESTANHTRVTPGS